MTLFPYTTLFRSEHSPIIHPEKKRIMRNVMKAATLESKFPLLAVETFEKFKEPINRPLLKTINHENKRNLSTLLALNFQLYDNAIYNRA
jgi:hypothetical protein